MKMHGVEPICICAPREVDASHQKLQCHSHHRLSKNIFHQASVFNNVEYIILKQN